LGDNQVYTTQTASPIWQHINTDAMTLSPREHSTNVPNSHKIIINGMIVKSSDYVEDMVAGFRNMYHFLTEHRTEILKGDAPLNVFTDCPIRYVYRPTFVYTRHLAHLQKFDFLHDGTHRWIASQIFKRALLKEQTDHRLWSLISGELAAMERLDVPWFGANTNSTHLYTDEGVIVEDVFENSPLEQTRSYIAGLCDEDQEQQIQLIYKAYAATEE
jgi:lantibiotic modifying enzyme